MSVSGLLKGLDRRLWRQDDRLLLMVFELTDHADQIVESCLRAGLSFR